MMGEYDIIFLLEHLQSLHGRRDIMAKYRDNLVKSLIKRRLLHWLALGGMVVYPFIPATSFVHGQDLSGTNEESVTTEDELSDESTSEMESETTVEDQTTIQEDQLIDSQAFMSLLPYTHYMNYQYSGDGSQFTRKDIIMEFMPDNQGIFQVAEFSDHNATAYIYQIRSDGLYELARFDHYDRVEDMRYSQDASDDLTSLILPAHLTPGTVYQSGYQKEKEAKVVGRVQSVTIGESHYQNVLVIEVIDASLPDQGLLRYYLADQYGIILVEQELPNGSKSNMMYLNTVQGPLF